MDHPGLKTGLNERRFTAKVFIQHHRTVQPHTAIPRLTRAPFRPHTAWIATGLGKNSQQKQTTQVLLILIVKLDT